MSRIRRIEGEPHTSSNRPPRSAIRCADARITPSAVESRNVTEAASTRSTEQPSASAASRASRSASAELMSSSPSTFTTVAVSSTVSRVNRADAALGAPLLLASSIAEHLTPSLASATTAALWRRCLEARRYHGSPGMFGMCRRPHTFLPDDLIPEGALPRMDSLSHCTDIELIAAHRDSGDPAPRDQLVMRHSGLVRSIARRYHGRGLPLEDIEQTGYVGLIQAVDRYDPSRGVPLRAYAARTIDGEIMHLFRDRGWAVRVPRSLQDLSRRVAAVRERMGHKLGRSPSLEELAEATGETEERVAEAIAAGRAYTAEPLVDPDAAAENAAGEGLPAGRVLASEE